LIENIDAQAKAVKPAPKAKTPVMTTAKKTVKAAPVKIGVFKKAATTKKITTTGSSTKKETVAPSVKKNQVKPNTDKKTTVATSASKKAKVSSAVAKGK